MDSGQVTRVPLDPLPGGSLSLPYHPQPGKAHLTLASIGGHFSLAQSSLSPFQLLLVGTAAYPGPDSFLTQPECDLVHCCPTHPLLKPILILRSASEYGGLTQPDPPSRPDPHVC